MEPCRPRTLAEHFASLDDPRVERHPEGTRLHPLLSIVTIAICAVIAGAESRDEIEQFGEAKADWFASFLDLPHGIPSRDTFNRVFAALDPIHFRTWLQGWMQAVGGAMPAQVIALDGKTIWGSHNGSAGKQAIHMISAWATANRLVLAQVKVDEKANEIIALPDLLGHLALAGCLVTVDAMAASERLPSRFSTKAGTTRSHSRATRRRCTRMSS
jgi:hypothetical protein